MKNKFFIILLSSSASIFLKAQNVGINTNTPTRTVDVNGNLRITELQNRTNNSNYNYLLSANKINGNIDYINISSLLQSEKNNMEVSRTIYNGSTADNTKECSCGDITFRFNGANSEIKLSNETVFASNGVNNLNLSYGIKRFTGNSYGYQNKTNVAFTNNNPALASYYNKYRNLDDTAFDTNNSIRVYTIVLPKQGNLYKLTLSRLQNTSTTVNFALICEKFYVQEL